LDFWLGFIAAYAVEFIALFIFAILGGNQK
jgi:hypothetical protein